MLSYRVLIIASFVLLLLGTVQCHWLEDISDLISLYYKNKNERRDERMKDTGFNLFDLLHLIFVGDGNEDEYNGRRGNGGYGGGRRSGGHLALNMKS
ncbi:unnamed protein product [Schistosoma turkestanicum]|nr:unnamed protein product [Schistosoma turkestanicum]